MRVETRARECAPSSLGDRVILRLAVDYPGIERLKLAVMGCIVNGPGESKHADIGISLPGTGETPAAPVFVDGSSPARRRSLSFFLRRRMASVWMTSADTPLRPLRETAASWR